METAPMKTDERWADSLRDDHDRTEDGLGALRRRPRVSTCLLLALLLVALGGCGNSPAEEPADESGDEQAEHADEAGAPAHDEHGDEHGEESEALRIPRDVQQRFGIATAPAGPGRVEVTLDLPGEIVADPDRILHVRPPFAGTIRRVFKHVGDTVEAGDALAVLVSTQALAPYTIEAGISGTITAEHAAAGESVTVAHDLFTLADTRTVWAQLQLFPDDLQRVHVDDPVEVLTPNAESGARGEISFINPVLDPATRSATVRVVLANDGRYRPGLFVTGRVAVTQQEAAVSVPSSALLREDDGWVVFVREDDDAFSRRPVEVGHRGIERSEIVAGLAAGEEVVSEGAFLVKSAAARSEMGGGHGH
jgi:cobalt-zinc-cadmium efflux system membrane fusion protein